MMSGKFYTIFGPLPPFHYPIPQPISNINLGQAHAPLVLMILMRWQPGSKCVLLFIEHLPEFIGRVHRPLLKVALDGGFETGDRFNLANVT